MSSKTSTLLSFSSYVLIFQVSKIAAFSVGGVFIGLQALSYNGIIKIDYDGVQKKIEVRKFTYHS